MLVQTEIHRPTTGRIEPTHRVGYETSAEALQSLSSLALVKSHLSGEGDSTADESSLKGLRVQLLKYGFGSSSMEQFDPLLNPKHSLALEQVLKTVTFEVVEDLLATGSVPMEWAAIMLSAREQKRQIKDGKFVVAHVIKHASSPDQELPPWISNYSYTESDDSAIVAATATMSYVPATAVQSARAELDFERYLP